jgi:D-glycero-alpha-D-manno-heptose-7-phosphate kinase
MIIVRSPLRITLGGGGTDLPSYYRDHEGFLIAGAIDKFVYVTLIKPFTPGIFLKYSKIEHVGNIEEVQHPIIREALKQFDLGLPQIEIATLADIPAGTGLGSSGSFTTALLRGLYAYTKGIVHAHDLAEKACHIEMDLLGESIGKQDQYIAVFGGITCFRFRRNGAVDVTPLAVDDEVRYALEDNLLLFFTGFTRSASQILKEQDIRTRSNDVATIEDLQFVKDIGVRSKSALESGDLDQFGRLMHEHWENKRRRSKAISNPQIDAWYDLARANGAIGGKLVGAGGGGFLMFYANDKARLRSAMRKVGLFEVRFRFDFEGTKLLVQ